MSLTQRLHEYRWYRKFIILLKRLRFGEDRVSVYHVLKVMLDELKMDSLTKRSSYMAFNFTLAIFPTIIFLFTLIPYIPIGNLDRDILILLGDMMPAEIYVVAADTIEDIVNKPRGGLLSFGFLFALVLSTNGIMSLMDAFDKKYKTFRRRTYLRKRVIATLLTIALALILFLAIAAIFFGTYILDALVFYEIVTESFTYGLIVSVKYVAVVLLFFLATSMIYYYVPAVHDKWPFVSAGSVVATVLIFLVSWLFSLYIGKFDSYNKFYGSIGALIGLMVWLDFVCMSLIVGFEVNISIDALTKRLVRGKV
ncbi:YihY/virulence factor BrkB family protein [Rufibacter sp. XAAS-G3-1]|uniref:YihY/virulence factor BrkB family protein n=1 Tax=Rufibacter sp. XAAS-G3-1 TaxID=2729134 RepID=UPI0015E711E6|nr:YihY/virulence factor BrkB family protein [Rufibacter sp. XAAS-G3-1]